MDGISEGRPTDARGKSDNDRATIKRPNVERIFPTIMANSRGTRRRNFDTSILERTPRETIRSFAGWLTLGTNWLPLQGSACFDSMSPTSAKSLMIGFVGFSWSTSSRPCWIANWKGQIGQWKADRGAFSHDSRFLAMPSAVWDLKAQARTWADQEPIKLVMTAGVAFSPNDRLLLVAIHTGQVLVRESETGREISRFEASVGLTCIAISPDGRLMATVDEDEGVKLWRASLRELQ
jgi:WD40 repeat protein